MSATRKNGMARYCLMVVSIHLFLRVDYVEGFAKSHIPIAIMVILLTKRVDSIRYPFPLLLHGFGDGFAGITNWT